MPPVVEPRAADRSASGDPRQRRPQSRRRRRYAEAASGSWSAAPRGRRCSWCSSPSIATEGVAWVAAERFRHSLEGIDGRALAETRASYEGIRAQSMLGTGLRLRVDRLLRSRLVAMADRVIADYRREEPTMAAPEWRQAQQALRWAAQISAGRSTTSGEAR